MAIENIGRQTVAFQPGTVGKDTETAQKSLQDAEKSARTVSDEIDLSEGARLAAGLRNGDDKGEELANALADALKKNERSLNLFAEGMKAFRKVFASIFGRG